MLERGNWKKSAWLRVFLRSMFYTAAAIILIIIGYFTAGFLSGGL